MLFYFLKCFALQHIVVSNRSEYDFWRHSVGLWDGGKLWGISVGRSGQSESLTSPISVGLRVCPLTSERNMPSMRAPSTAPVDGEVENILAGARETPSRDQVPAVFQVFLCKHGSQNTCPRYLWKGPATKWIIAMFLLSFPGTDEKNKLGAQLLHPVKIF